MSSGPGSQVSGSGPGRSVVRMRQVHGATVHRVYPGDELLDVGEGDAVVATRPEIALAVLTADCASVALGSPEGVFAAAHAGWRGLEKGIVEATVAAMREMGAGDVVAGIGPCIGPCCYEFSRSDSAVLVEHYGERVESLTPQGKPSLDLATGVRSALDAARARVVFESPTCTACSPGWYSWRARRDECRQAMFVWLSDR